MPRGTYRLLPALSLQKSFFPANHIAPLRIFPQMDTSSESSINGPMGNVSSDCERYGLLKHSEGGFCVHMHHRNRRRTKACVGERATNYTESEMTRVTVYLKWRCLHTNTFKFIYTDRNVARHDGLRFMMPAIVAMPSASRLCPQKDINVDH